MRKLLIAVATLALAAPAAAQQQGHAQHAQGAMPDHSKYPAGWQVRVDRDAPRDQVWLMDHGDALHAATGPRGAVYYNTGWSGTGDYAYAVRFRQAKATEHPEGYGLVIGGQAMEGADQAYTYFLVRQTGEYYIATRRGDALAGQPWKASPAIQKIDAQGQATNVLGVEVKGDEVVFSVNGTEVERKPKSGLATEGVQGIRVNHHLELLVDQVKR